MLLAPDNPHARQPVAVAVLPTPSPIAHVCRHESYQPSSFCNDVAVLELEQDAVHARPIGSLMQPAPGWPNLALPAGYPLVAAGWGYTGWAGFLGGRAGARWLLRRSWVGVGRGFRNGSSGWWVNGKIPLRIGPAAGCMHACREAEGGYAGPDTLRYATLPYIPHSVCDQQQEYSGRVLQESMLCAGKRGVSARACACTGLADKDLRMC